MRGKNVLILEDNKDRMAKFKRRLIGNRVTYARWPREAISHLRSGSIDVLFLDHDLNGVLEESGPGTGYEVAEWLARNPKFMPKQIILHSLNDVGRKNMRKVLPKAVEHPFWWEEQ